MYIANPFGADQITEQVRVELGQTIPQPDPTPESPQATEDHTETGGPPSDDAG